MKKLFIYIAVLLAGFTAFAPTVIGADDSSLFQVCNAQTQNSPVCTSRETKTNPVTHVIKVAADIVAIAAGAAAVVVIIVGGITMITSAGNAEAVANSRKRITAALIGLVIVALAWTIIAFVTEKLIK